MCEGLGNIQAEREHLGKLSREYPTHTELFCFIPPSPSGGGEGMKLSDVNRRNNWAKAPPRSLPLPNPAGPGMWAR